MLLSRRTAGGPVHDVRNVGQTKRGISTSPRLQPGGPAGLVCSSAPSDSPNHLSARDWLWLTRAVITTLVATDVEGRPQARALQLLAVALPAVPGRPGPEVVVDPHPGYPLPHVPSQWQTKRETVTRHDLPDQMALILHTAVGDVRWASIQELELLCRARGSSLLLVVRSAESALQRCQQDRDRHIQSLRDDDQVLDGPTSPAA
jgi:hypothetical protein